MGYRLAGRLLLLGIVTTVPLSLLVPSTSGYLEATIPLFWIALAGLLSRHSFVEIFSTRPASSAYLVLATGLGLSIAGSFITFEVALDYVTKGAWERFIQRVPDSPLPSSLSVAIFIVAYLCVTEELLFRGFLVPSFDELGIGAAVFIPAMIFTLLHAPINMPVALLMSVIGACLLLTTKSVWPAAAMHSVNNLIGLIINRTFPTKPMIPSVIVLLAGIGLLYSQRRNFKDLMNAIREAWRDLSISSLKAMLSEWSYVAILVLSGMNVVAWFALVAKR
ncbi:MAG TPA: CPBP family intramembrane metalloprotease [Firmicutes bacterium]|nr:CPBP family intramembrane metalloprotease [Candidatus Fermentithermobacillaceae bacterium]